MAVLPQLIPVSELRYNHREVFSKLKTGIVLLAQRSRPAAVLVSVEEWERRARRLNELEGLLEAKRAIARIDAGLATTTSLEDLKQQLAQSEGMHVTPLGN
jgi:prevent-host-death family protein